MNASDKRAIEQTMSNRWAAVVLAINAAIYRLEHLRDIDAALAPLRSAKALLDPTDPANTEGGAA